MYCHNHKHFSPSATHMLILLFSFFCLPLKAATISVDGTDGSVANDGVCTISEAIINANDDAHTHVDCVAGSGADTINLSADITLTTEYENDPSWGRTGTPAISTAVVLDGQGYVLERDGNLLCNMNDNNESGEFRLLQVANNGNLQLENTVIRGGCVDGNRGWVPEGGGIHNRGSLSLLNTVIEGNQAAFYGGGVMNHGDISGIINSTFSNNSANTGGGLASDGNIALISNSTFSNNSAKIGGAIVIDTQGTISSINNSTFSGNTAPDGSAVFVNIDGQINIIENSLFHNGSICKTYGFFFNGSNNIADTTSGAGCPGVLATTLDTTTVGPLADNGCTTPLADGSCIMTHALLPGSEALDMAVGGTATDQRGFNAAGTRDIGAYELQAIELCPVALQTDGFNTTVSTDAELIEAIECANANGEANGGDIINLGADITLTTEYENDPSSGRTGTPSISTAVVLDGQGHVLERDGSLLCNINDNNELGEFRLLRVVNNGNLELENTVIRGGCVDSNGGDSSKGGGILNIGTLSLLNSVIDGNQARRHGGGVYSISGDIDGINNTTFSNNISGSLGGGLSQWGGNISVISNSTFSNNSAYNGGAIDLFHVILSVINNSTFSGSTESNGSVIFNDESAINEAINNLFYNGSNCEYNPGADSSFNGNNNLADATSGAGCPGVLATTLTTATVGPLADNGCTTPLADGSCIMTHALLPGSEALDVAVGGTATDQRGFNADGTRDIGAYELQAIELCPVALQTDGFNTNVSTDTELIEAIECANLNGEANGGDTINLGADITLTTEYENDPSFGRTGTPAVSTAIVLDGQGHVLERDGSLLCNMNDNNELGEFRLLRVANGGDLSLNNIIIRGGCVDDNHGHGGGIFSYGILSLINTVIDGNQAAFNGGGVFSNQDISGIINSTFSNNSARYGGGLSHFAGDIEFISNSTFSNNSARFGGAIDLYYATISVINNNTFSGNTAPNGSAINNDHATTNEAINNLFHNGSNCTINGTFNSSSNLADATSGDGCPGVLATTLDATTVGPLADNGCTTPLADGSCIMTHALLPGSEALDMSVGGTVTDNRGFNADGTRDIGAYEAQIPVITAPADIIVEATGPTTITPPLGTAVATDADSDDLALSIFNDAAANYTLGGYTVTWTVTDNHGFQNTDTQTVTTQDTTPPVLSLIGTTPVNLNVGDAYTDAGATATDLVDDDAVLTGNILVNNPVDTNVAGTYTVTYDVSDNAGNAASQITRTVHVNGYPQIQLSASTINFGGVLIGQNEIGVITVTNSGTADLLINSLNPLTAPFSVTGGSCDPLPMTLMPSESCSIEVSYNPTEAGEHITQLVINSNAPSSPHSVELSGNSYAQAIPVTALNQWAFMLLLFGFLFIVYLSFRHKLDW